MYAPLSDSKLPPFLISICVNAEAFIRLTDPGWIDFTRGFLASSIITSSTTKTHHHPTPILLVWNAGLHHTRTLPRTGQILPLSTAQPTGEHGSPSGFRPFFSTPFSLLQLSRSTKWCCLGSQACFRFHCHPDSLLLIPFSCIFIVFTCLLCHQIPPPPPTYLRACRSLCIRRRCSLSSPSQFSRQPKPEFRHRHCASLKHTNPSQPFTILLFISAVPPSLTTPGRLNFFHLCAT